MSAGRTGIGSGRWGSRGWWAKLSESVESRLWPVPLAAVIVAVALGILLPRIDLVVDSSLPTAVDSAVFNGGAETARSVLSSIAGSLVTATSLTFSLTVIALQLASSQASPRVLRLFARDRQVHWTLAAFLGTFAYSITVLRSVRSSTEDVPEFVPRIAVTLAFAMTLVSVIMLVFFLAHLAAQLRVETMLKEIHADTDRVIELVSERNTSMKAFVAPVILPAAKRTVVSPSSGFLTGQDHGMLLRIAAEQSIVVEEVREVGENIVKGTPLAFWWHTGEPGEQIDAPLIDAAISKAYGIGYERTAAEDIDYGFEQILDIGLRALSPGVNDPTTAVHALGHLTALTASTIQMPRLPAALAGDGGELRVVTRTRGVADDIEAALAPMRHYGAAHPAVVERLIRAIDELSSLAPDHETAGALEAQLSALMEQLGGIDQDPAATEDMLRRIESVRARVRQRSVVSAASR